MNYNKRLKRLEVKTDTSDYPEVIEWIKQGRYYNDLTYDEKLLYNEYQEFGDRGMAKATIDVENMIYRNYDEPPNFKLKIRRKRKEPTPEEFAETVKEVERIVDGMKEEYNSSKQNI